MKKVIVAILMMGFFSVAAMADTVKVKINGMVCSFCAQGLTKKFSAEEAVSKVDVSLEKKVMQLDLKPGKSISDEKITQLITDSGYKVEKIERPKGEKKK